MLTSSSVDTSSVYTDFAGLTDLKRQAAGNEAQATKKVAKEFEAIFVQMMLKSMREASPEGGLFDSDQMQAYQGMFDQQLGLNISHGSGIGLAEVIERQLNSLDGVAKTDTVSSNDSLQKAALLQRSAA